MRVVAGVIFNARGEVLLSQRPEGKHLAGLWEFPGGKMEPLETEIDALKRELQEELELKVSSLERVGEFPYTYPKGPVLLIVFTGRALNEPRSTEGAALRWMKPQDIVAQELAPADIPVLSKLTKFGFLHR